MNRQNREARAHLPAHAEAVGDAITALAGADEREPKWWCTYPGDVRGTFDGNQPRLTLDGDRLFSQRWSCHGASSIFSCFSFGRSSRRLSMRS